MPDQATSIPAQGPPFDGRAGRSLRRLFGKVWTPVLPSLLLLAAMLLVRLHGTVEPDVAWQLWIARRINHGARLYRDIVEVNPPLWFWMAIPIDRLADLLRVRSDALLIVTMGIASMLSVAATSRLLQHVAAARRTLFLLCQAVFLFAVPWLHIGQREQIVLIGAVPYAALLAARRSGRAVSPLIALLIGTGAALGFALKHYFALVPAMLELWLYCSQRRSWRLIRPEVAALVCVAAAYALSVAIFARDFLTITLPLVRLAYGATDAPSFTHLLQPAICIGAVMVALLAAQWRAIGRHAPVAAALSVAAVSFGAAYFLQDKGWIYHAIPFVGCASLALAGLLAEIDDPPRLLRLAAPALLSLPLLTTVQESRLVPFPPPELVQSAAVIPDGDSIAFLSAEPALAWSITLQHDYRYSSRYYSYWMLFAIAKNERAARPDPRLVKLGREVAAQTVVDFRCVPPRWIVVAPPARDRPAGSFDLLGFFERDPAFTQFFSNYRLVRRGTILDMYELAAPMAPLSAPACRGGV